MSLFINIFKNMQLFFLFVYLSGFVEIGNTRSYMEHKEKYIKKGRGKKFLQAVSECEHHIKDPTVFSFAFI